MNEVITASQWRASFISSEGENILQLLMWTHFFEIFSLSTLSGVAFGDLVALVRNHRILIGHKRSPISSNNFQDNELFSNLIWHRIYYLFEKGWRSDAMRCDANRQMNRLNYSRWVLAVAVCNAHVVFSVD